MKKINVLLFVISFLIFPKANAQLEFAGSEDYGRIFNITYHPDIENRLYATSLHNHILVSEDNGQSWEVFFSLSFQEVFEFQQLRMTDNNTALSVIKYNLDSPNNTLLIIDLETASIAREIEIPYSSSSKYIDAYSIYPDDSNVILMNAVIDFGNVGFTYYTTDGGNTWDEVYSRAANDNVAVNSVAISPDDPQKLIIARGFGPGSVDGGLFISSDAGVTWEEKLQGAILTPIAFNPFNTDEIYTGTGISFGQTTQNLFRSTDGGDTWNAVPLIWTEGFLDCINFIAFNPNAMGEIIVLEENEIVISNDNGASWTHYSYTDPEDVHSYYSGWNLSFNPFRPSEVFINSDYFPLFSADGGVTTTWSKNNFFKSTGTVALFQNSEEHLYYGVQFGYIHKNLTTGEETPVDIMPLNFYSQGDAPRLFVDNVSASRVYTFSSGWFGSNFYLSDDYGLTKHQAFSTYMNFVDAVVTNPLNTNEVWVSLSNTMGEFELRKLDVTDVMNVSSQNIILPAQGTINGIHFDPVQAGAVMISAGTSVYKSMDGGVSWSISSTGLEALNPDYDLILGFSKNPLNENQFTLATNLGVFTSLDGGSTWESIYNGLVYKLYHSTVTDGHLVGVIYSSGISEFSLIASTDGGENWQTINNEVFYQTASASASVQFFKESATVYIGSIDLGLLQYNIAMPVLSTEDFQHSEDVLVVYPNPVKEQMNLHIKNDTITQASVYSISGQKIMEVANTNTLSLSALQKGVYFVRVNTASGKTASQKIVKL